MARRIGRKRRTAAQRRATARMIAANRSRRRAKAAPKRRRRKVTRTYKRRTPTVARRKRVTHRRRRASSRTRRRSTGSISLRRVRGAIYKRNPPLMGMLYRGVKDAVAVTAGKAGTRIVAGMLPIPQDGIMGIAGQAVAALGLGWAANKFLGADIARFVVAGGLSAPIEAAAKNLPVIGPALSGDDDLGAYELGAYELNGDMPMGELPMGAYESMGAEAYS